MTTNVEGSTTAYVLLPQTQTQLASPGRERATRVVIPALLTGALLWLCYFPVACGWLGWVALVPLLVLVRAEGSGRRIYLSAWLAGLSFFWPVLQWLRIADDRMYYTWAALATYCSFYFVAGIALLRLLDRRTRLPLVLTLPVVWTALEYLRSFLMTGFAWYFLGHTQHDFLPVIQVADLGGAYAVTFVLATVNALVFELLTRIHWFRKLCVLSEPTSHLGLPFQAAFVVLLTCSTLAYGVWRLSQTEFAPGPLVALIQSNLDQRIKLAGTNDSFREMFEHNRQLTNYACTQDRRPDLIVWSETSLPGEWRDSETGSSVIQQGEAREVLSWITDRWKTNMLLGVTGRVHEADGKDRTYNSAVLVRPDGKAVGRYDKMHRVPFGEFVPMIDCFPWMANFAAYDYDYGVEIGKKWTRFDVDGHRFGLIICYEDTDPELAREYADPSASTGPVDFLLNISNDGWFNGIIEHEQHLAIARFRAVECRRAVARAVNMGISAVIDGNGRVLQPDQGYLVRADGNGFGWNWKGLPGTAPVGGEIPMSQWAPYKQAAGVLLTSIPIDHRESVYARFGDWLPQGCWLFLVLGVIVAVCRPRSGARG